MHIHLLGICGTGMAALAGILKEQGHRVSGSDEHAYPPMSTYLAGLGIVVQNGYAPENLAPRPDLAVVGKPAASSGNRIARGRRWDLRVPLLSPQVISGSATLKQHDRDAAAVDHAVRQPRHIADPIPASHAAGGRTTGQLARRNHPCISKQA